MSPHRGAVCASRFVCSTLIWNQFSSPAYRDMVRHAWHNTDPDYSTSELVSGPPVRMIQEIQFGFDSSARCAVDSEQHAFIRCSHCGKLLSLEHFLKTTCFHEPNDDEPTPGPSGQGGGSSHSDDSHDDLRRKKTNKI